MCADEERRALPETFAVEGPVRAVSAMCADEEKIPPPDASALEELLLSNLAQPRFDPSQLVGHTGAWLGVAGSDFHHHDAGLAPALAAFLSFQRPRRVIDMGCGLGEYVKALRARGVACDGFDGHADTAVLTNGMCYTADFSDPALPDDIAKAEYDWCICLEVFEHVPVHLEGQLIKCMLAGTGRGLVVSVATPGQGGLGHVNERPHEYVIDLLEGQGLVLDVITSVKLRQYAALPWFQSNTLVFRRQLASCSGEGRSSGLSLACAQCDKVGCKLRCAVCQQVWYCSAACQCEAWPQHKQECGSAPSASVAPLGADGAERT